MKHLDLFSGIGGFALAADRVFGDVEHTFVEIDPFCQAILKKHYPKSKIYGDIRTLANAGSKEQRRVPVGTREEVPKNWHGADLLTGGFPCQPFSHAGRRKGTADDRYLWPEMFRVIQLYKPTWVIAENVRGLVTWNDGMVLEKCCSDLESEGYEVQPFIIPACAVGAPHRRDRVWIVGHRNDAGSGASESKPLRDGAEDSKQRENSQLGCGGQDKSAYPYSESGRSGRHGESGESDGEAARRGRHDIDSWERNWAEVAQRFCQLDDGLPYRLAGFGIDETCAIMGYILLVRDNFYGTKNSTRTEEVLSALQKATTPQAFSELLRGYGEVQKEEILRCAVHGESNDERESKPWSLLSKSEKAQRKEMRKVWHDTVAQYPPYQRGLERQCSCQFDDIVRELSSPIALEEWKENAEEATDILFRLWKKSGGIGVLHEPLSALQEVWQSLTDKKIGSFRRHYYLRNDNRNPRLKAYGNAIVPQVAEKIMRAIAEEL